MGFNYSSSDCTIVGYTNRELKLPFLPLLQLKKEGHLLIRTYLKPAPVKEPSLPSFIVDQNEIEKEQEGKKADNGIISPFIINHYIMTSAKPNRVCAKVQHSNQRRSSSNARSIASGAPAESCELGYSASIQECSTREVGTNNSVSLFT